MGKLSACLLLAATLVAAGCNRQDTERLSNIGKKLAARAESVTAPVRQELGAQLSSLSGTPESRVSTRLRWDKLLAEANIEVRGTPEAIELKGTVKSEDQRRRAVEIAETTTGVGKVSDALQVAEK